MRHLWYALILCMVVASPAHAQFDPCDVVCLPIVCDCEDPPPPPPPPPPAPPEGTCSQNVTCERLGDTVMRQVLDVSASVALHCQAAAADAAAQASATCEQQLQQVQTEIAQACGDQEQRCRESCQAGCEVGILSVDVQCDSQLACEEASQVCEQAALSCQQDCNVTIPDCIPRPVTIDLFDALRVIDASCSPTRPSRLRGKRGNERLRINAKHCNTNVAIVVE